MVHIVESRHPAYEEWIDSWLLMRRAFDGEDAIKLAGETYLPAPGGFAQAPDPVAAYIAYAERAVFPEIVAPTIRGMSGVMHAKPAVYEVPDSMAGIIEEATRDGLTLDALHRSVTREVLQVGRFGLLADVSQGGEPYVATYRAEAILNWDVGEDGRLSMVLLDESDYERNPETYAWETVGRWRLLELDEAGSYAVRRFIKASGAVVEEEVVEPRLRGGTRLDFIPFVFVDTNNLTPAPEEIPLYPLAKTAISIYRLEADYRRALYLTAQPTPVIIGTMGMDPDPAQPSAPMTIGSAVPWIIPPPGDAKFLEFTGAGISAQRTAIRDDMERAVQLGARLLADQTGREESGEARRLRYAAETATLTSIAQTCGAGMEAVLRFIARWVGAAPEAITVTPNLDFTDVRLSAQDIDALVRGWMSSAYSYDTLFDNLQRGGVIADDVTADEERERIDTQAPRLTGEPVDLA